MAPLAQTLGPCLVTGGGGFLGTEIVRQLREAGCPVTSASRRRYAHVEALGATCVELDVRDAEAVRRVVDGHRTVFHVAAVPGAFGPRERYWSANFEGTRHVLRAAVDAGAERFLHTSSPSVVFDGRHHRNATTADTAYPERFLSPYPESKAAAEQLVLAEESLPVVALRPHLIVGPGDPNLLPRLIDRARAGRLAIVGAGTNRVSLTDVRNAASAHLQAAERLGPDAPHRGRAYFVNQSESVVLWDWVHQVLDAAGAPRPRRRVSAKTAYRVGAVLEAAWKLLRRPGEPPMSRFIAQQLALDHTYSLAEAERDFGYVERWSLAECTEAIVDALRPGSSQV